MKVDYPAMLMKFGCLALILTAVPYPYSLLVCLFATWAYQYVIAFAYGIHAMPTMDQMVFLGRNDIRANIISFTIIDNYPFDKVRKHFRQLISDKPKLRMKIVKIWGDYYWAEMGIDEALDHII